MEDDDPDFAPIPRDPIGDHMDADEWLGANKAGIFIRSDGDGYWATDKEVSSMSVWRYKRPEWATHVMWYNK